MRKIINDGVEASTRKSQARFQHLIDYINVCGIYQNKEKPLKGRRRCRLAADV